MYLPQVEPAPEVVPVRNSSSDNVEGRETVLLVEDEPVVRELAAFTLQERGYTVFEAANGEEGLRIAKEKNGNIDLVLTDVVMPVMGGKEMADAIRASHPQTRILFASGYTEDALGHHGVLQPGVAFLQKPYLTATLARIVREVLDEP